MQFTFSFDRGVTFPFSALSGSTPDTLYQAFIYPSGAVPQNMVMKVIFSPTADRKQTPELGRVMFYGDVRYDIVEDVVRTMKRVLKAHAKPFLRFRFVHAGGSTLTLKSRINPSSLKIYKENERWAVANLVASYNPGTNVVTLTSSLSAGTVLEVQGEMAWASSQDQVNALQVRIRPEPDYVRSHTPMYVVRHLESRNYADGFLGGDEVERRWGPTQPERFGRLVERPVPVDLTIAIDAVAEREVEAYAMIRSVRDLMERDDKTGIWQSLGMGYFFDIISITPLTDVSIPEDEFHDFQVRAIIGAKEYQSVVQEAPLAERIEILVGNTEKVIVNAIDGD